MLQHPSRLFSTDPLLPEGGVVVRLFKPWNLDTWKQKGAALSRLRKLRHSANLMDLLNRRTGETVWVTDDPEKMLQSGNPALTEGFQIFSGLDDQPADRSDLVLLTGSISSKAGSVEKNPVFQRRLLLLNLLDRRDTRWKRMGMPVAHQLIIGSLENRKHRVRYMSVFSDDPWMDKVPECDCVAIGVYEDSFIETLQVVQQVARLCLPVILGGPMVSLQGEAVAAHAFPASAFFRGEVEETLPDYLDVCPMTGDSITLASLEKISKLKGILALGEDWWVLGHFETIPRIEDFSGICVSSNHLAHGDVVNGIEYSTSRGCPRACTFCSRVHGRKLRKYPLTLIDSHLKSIRNELETRLLWNPSDNRNLAINVNDDDLLLDPRRALQLLKIFQENGFRIWGIQTSIESLSAERTREWLFSELQKNNYFVEHKPLFWIGTDGFTESRMKRLGKRGSQETLEKICRAMDRVGFTGYHYWILTDADSDWAEFFEEMAVLRRLTEIYPESFHIMPNAATLIPYPSTDVYRRRIRDGRQDQIMLQAIMQIAGYPEFDYPLVMHERPSSDFLYALVEPKAQSAERILTNPRRFLDLIRESRIDEAIVEAVRMMTLELQWIRDQERKQELSELRERIISGWSNR